jgi:hypothetical protein
VIGEKADRMNASRTVLIGLFALTFAGASRLLAGEGQRVQVPACGLSKVLFQ